MPRIVRGGLIQAKNVLGPEAGLPAIKVDDEHVDELIAAIAERSAEGVGHDDNEHGRHQEQRHNAARVFEDDFQVFDGERDDLTKHDRLLKFDDR